ncbi:MAG TPA: hypothetical protein VIX35_01510, partial [Vicinamibacterales bacterium]
TCRVPLTGEHHVFTQQLWSTRLADPTMDLKAWGPLERQKVGELTDGPLWLPRPFGDSLRLLGVERNIGRSQCFDIMTDDGFVYLPEYDVTVSNCDDAATVLIASMLTIGIPAMVIGSSHKHPHDVPTHVFGAFQDEQDDWVRMDGTTKHPVGRVAAHGREWWVEPGAEAKNRGEGDFVGMAGVGGEVGTGDRAREPVSALDLMYPHIK